MDMRRLSDASMRNKQRLLSSGRRYDVIAGDIFSPQMRRYMRDRGKSNQIVHEAISVYMYIVQNVNGRPTSDTYLWCDHTIQQIADGALVERRRVSTVTSLLEECGLIIRHEVRRGAMVRYYYIPTYAKELNEYSTV